MSISSLQLGQINPYVLEHIKNIVAIDPVTAENQGVVITRIKVSTFLFYKLANWYQAKLGDVGDTSARTEHFWFSLENPDYWLYTSHRYDPWSGYSYNGLLNKDGSDVVFPTLTQLFYKTVKRYPEHLLGVAWDDPNGTYLVAVEQEEVEKNNKDLELPL